MSSKSKIAKETVEVEVKSNGRPVRNISKPVSYKEENTNKKGQASSEPANRKKKVNSNENAVPSKKVAAGKKKSQPESENGNDDVEAPANENGSKVASRKRKNAADDKVNVEKVDGSKAPKKATSRQKKIEETVDAQDDDDVEPEEAPDVPEVEKDTKPASRKKVKEPVDNASSDNGSSTSKTVVSKGSKVKKADKQPVTETEGEADNKIENAEDDNQTTSKAVAATKGNKGKKKGKETVPAPEQPTGDLDAEDDEEIVPSKAVASKTAKDKKTTKGSANSGIEDAEGKVDDKKKTSRQPKKPKEPASKATTSKSAKANQDELVPNVAGKQRATKRKLGPIQDEADKPKVFKRRAPKAQTPVVDAAPKEKLNSTESKVVESLPTKTWNFKICSWNVSGLRSFIQKGGMKFVQDESPDIFCVQETKCLPEEVPDHLSDQKYHKYWLGKKGGKGGVGLYSKVMPYNVDYGINNEEMDSEARVITAEYTKFFVVCVYVPNSGRKLVTLPKRLDWDKLFQEYLVKLNSKKPVIVVGDMNVSHLEIDLANPKSNKRNAGFTNEERDGMSHMLSLGFVDTFRELYPDLKNAYTFWTYMANARSKNIGWRLDYFIVSQKLMAKVVDSVIRPEIMGSDHCPITLLLNI